MKRNFKFIFKMILILISTTLFFSLAHFYAFPQESRCILVDYYGLERQGNLYYGRDTSKDTINKIVEIISKAEARNVGFWGQKICQPKFIFCNSDEDFIKFGNNSLTPAAAYMKLGSYIVINQSGINLDIISHEISHAELYERIGFFNKTFKIPTWFDEGLAMQVDYRAYYSEQNLMQKTIDLNKFAKVKELYSGNEFQSGTIEQVMLNYSMARYEVSKWYSKERLDKFIEDIKERESFEKAYNYKTLLQ